MSRQFLSENLRGCISFSREIPVGYVPFHRFRVLSQGSAIYILHELLWWVTPPQKVDQPREKLGFTRFFYKKPLYKKLVLELPKL